MTELDELSRLLEQATPGPWRDDNGYRVYADTPEGEVLLLSTKQTCATFADSGLIAALRNCAEELIRDARRMEWVESHATFIDSIGDSDNRVRVWFSPNERSATGSTVREAIDAAMVMQP